MCSFSRLKSIELKDFFFLQLWHLYRAMDISLAYWMSAQYWLFPEQNAGKVGYFGLFLPRFLRRLLVCLVHRHPQSVSVLHSAESALWSPDFLPAFHSGVSA
jgi:hypothetical protein